MDGNHILIWQKKDGNKIRFLAAKVGKNKQFEKMLVSSRNDNSDTRRSCKEAALALAPGLPVFYSDWDFGPVQKRDGVYGYVRTFIPSGIETFIKQASWKEARQAEADRETQMKKNIRAL